MPDAAPAKFAVPVKCDTEVKAAVLLVAGVNSAHVRYV